MSLGKLVELREMNQDDRRFVASSWFESYWKLAMQKTNMPFLDYRRGQDARIRRLMDEARTLVVYAAHIPDEILGYIVFEPGVLHWVYVKSAYRREGIAAALCKQNLKWYTHTAAEDTAGRKLIEKLGLAYNPYLLER